MKKMLYIASAALVMLAGCTTKSESGDPQMDRFISKVMSRMSLEEKIGQLNLASNWTYVSNATLSDQDVAVQQLKAGQMGAFYGFTNQNQMRQLQEIAMQRENPIPLMFGNDVIHGLTTTYPIPLASASSWNMDLIEEGARKAALEATAVGINWVFSPMVDICRDARWGRISEGAGEDPYLGGEIAKAYVRGYQGDDLSADNTVMACVKHYALYGGAEAGRDYNSVFLSRQEAHNGFLNPYKQAALAGAGSYMASFNEFEGIPASCNQYLLDDVLRGQWGFNGFVVSDATALNECIAHGIGDQAEVSRRCIEAGLDMDMGSNAYVSNLAQLVRDGKVSEKDIDRACRHILEAKYKLGLFEDPYRYLVEGREETQVFTADKHDYARRIARESQVLLKNNGVLPLKKNARIALVGPFANDAAEMQGAWAASGRSGESVTILQGVENALQGGSVKYAQGSWLMKDAALEESIKYGLMRIFAPNAPMPPVHTVPQSTLVAQAVAAARNADVVVACVGEANNMNGEGASRTDITIPDAQRELLQALKATGKPLVIVLSTGRPLILDWESENADAILNTWNLGHQAGNAIADVLFGDVNPSGKLTASFPRSVGQLPLYYNHKNTGRPHPDDKPYQKFTSCYEDVLNGPLYCFGYGLSYTSYQYGKVRLSANTLGAKGSVTASVDVTNTGSADGLETVQLYIHDVYSSSTRPVKELRGFKKVAIPAGQTVSVDFTLTQEDLKYYNHALEYVCEPGDFEIMIGPDCNHLEMAVLTAE